MLYRSAKYSGQWTPSGSCSPLESRPRRSLGCHHECGNYDGDSASAPPMNPMLSRWAKYSGRWTPSGSCSPSSCDLGERRVDPHGPNTMGSGLLLDGIVNSSCNLRDLGLPSRVRRLDGSPAPTPPTNPMLYRWAKYSGRWTPSGCYSPLQSRSRRTSS